MKAEDFLVEIQTEELPGTELYQLGYAFCQQIKDRLQKSNLGFAGATFFATPRRIAVLVKDLIAYQPDQIVERKGPSLAQAFDTSGHPSQAQLGFARSLGVLPSELLTVKNEQGEWLLYRQAIKGKSVYELLPTIVLQSLNALPRTKWMHWNDGDTLFIRPVHSVIMLYGKEVIKANILGCDAGLKTSGHRFHAPHQLDIPEAKLYEGLLATKAHVIPDFIKRKEKIIELSKACVQENLKGEGELYPISDELLNEVTGLVEWPIALFGHFDSIYLALPKEVLISAMEDHQRYFPIVDKNLKLLPHFVTISNIQSEDAKRVVLGNERVLRARLSDAAFFYETDKEESLEARIPRLKGIVFHAHLGTLYEKVERMKALAAFIAKKINIDENDAKRASLLSKTDLTTQMVNEFPELQGVMGHYYALYDKEHEAVASAIEEHYLPRFAGDKLPASRTGEIVALADRIDTIISFFGINQIPTGDKDPFGLRRAALAIIRILIEKEINLDLKDVFEFAFSSYTHPLENEETVSSVLNFIQERCRHWYQDQGVSPDIFAAVQALSITDLFDMHLRIKALQTFKQWREAEALSIANKRVTNILAQYADTVRAKTINPTLFEDKTENELANRINEKSKLIITLSQSKKYEEVLLQLAGLRQPIDDFFDHVMVMTEDKPRRENRILLLKELRQLFLNVADIALLQ
jgi:glycyl-tRNA synthetase beta chain